MDNTKIPDFVQRDPTEIMVECKTQLENFLGRELQPAQVEQLILQFIVYREVLLLQRFNAGMSQMLYQFSTAPILDYIAGLVAIERLPASRAGCTVRFNLVAGHGTVIIPEGTRVATSDGNVIFQTSDDVIVTPTLNSVEIKVIAETSGKSGNGYDIGTVNKILDPLAFVSTVANIDITGGGSDVETDEQLRARIKLAPSQFSSAGARSSYEFYARSANALITDVSVSSPIPGTVFIVALTETGDTPEQVITDIYNTCSPENVRPLTDTVIVASPTRVEYQIDVNVVLYENMDSTTVKNELLNILQEYTREKREKLGLDIVRSDIAAKTKINSVYDVEVLKPTANLEIDYAEFAECTNIIINITGFSRG